MSQSSKYTAGIIYVIANEGVERTFFTVCVSILATLWVTQIFNPAVDPGPALLVLLKNEKINHK